jgi:hypothetical protein
MRDRGRSLIELQRRELEFRRRQMQRRERREFGGRIQWEAVFFGLLAGIGLGASLVAMVLGGMVAAGVTSFHEDAASLVDHVMTGGGLIPIAILALSYLAGGYVAARMARFNGLRQGLGLWLLSLVIGIVVAITAWIAGGDIDPTKSITLPSNPIDEGPLSDSGWAILAVGVLVPLISSIAGGALGERFHRAVDRVGTDEFEAVPDNEREADYEPEAETDVQSDADADADSDPTVEDQPYGPDRVKQDAPASAASSSDESTVSPAAKP